MALTPEYEAAGFGLTLGFGRQPVLVIIDMAMAYFTPGSPLYAAYEPALDATIRVADTARATGVPIIFTRVDYAHPADGGLFRRKIAALSVFETGSPLAAFHPRLQPQPGDQVISKHYPSAFFGTPLAGTLSSMRADSLIITGLSTSGCIRATALDALCYGFAPLVVQDAVGDRTPTIHDANLFDLQAKTADVMGSDAVIEWLRRR